MPVSLEFKLRDLRRFWRDDWAQDTLEMMLVTGTVVVLMIAGLWAGFQLLIPEVLANLCPAVDTMFVPPPTPPASVGSCTTP